LLLNRFTKHDAKLAFFTLLSCVALIIFFNSTSFELEVVAIVYLTLAYVLFVTMLFVKWREKKAKLIYTKNINPYVFFALTLLIVVCLMTVLEIISSLRWLYNTSAILAYCVLLFHIINFVHKKMPTAADSLDYKQRNFYTFYAIVLVAIFLISPTMEQSDPYGPHFQLRFVFWILLAHIIISWIFNQWKLTKQLQNERVNAELMHLKNQINPHFFFNTLNNLYGLAREKSEQTPDLILRLSDMMRYTIYQGEKDMVAIEDEIAYMENFIELQKIRFQKDVKVSFENDIDDIRAKVSPLLFINLLENAYKHGVEKLTSKAFVNIYLTIKQGKLQFSIENNFDIEQISSKKGIGISNLKKRLELLYPRKHSFNSSVTNGHFKAVISITLTSARGI